METQGCHNCEHEFMNHKRCDLPWGVKCNSGEKWEKRIDVLSKFMAVAEPARTTTKEQSIIANVMPSVCDCPEDQRMHLMDNEPDECTLCGKKFYAH